MAESNRGQRRRRDGDDDNQAQQGGGQSRLEAQLLEFDALVTKAFQVGVPAAKIPSLSDNPSVTEVIQQKVKVQAAIQEAQAAAQATQAPKAPATDAHAQAVHGQEAHHGAEKPKGPSFMDELLGRKKPADQGHGEVKHDPGHGQKPKEPGFWDTLLGRDKKG